MSAVASDICGRAGGLAVRSKTPPAFCPRSGCEKHFPKGTKWHSYLGHLGLHGLADKYFNGDLHAAQAHLRSNGLASGDPAPWNNAWPKYKPLPDAKETA
jgi:hypothetical protein